MGAADGREAGRGHGLWGLLVHGLKYAVLKMVVMLIYVVSHLYDYAFYPIYFFYYHPWRVRRYQKSTHARREDLDHESAVIFHSLTEPTKVNREMVENGLDTMERVFNHISKKYGSQDCLGTRQILGEEAEPQPNGKTFVKYVLGQYEWRSFNQVEAEVRRVADGLRARGLHDGARLAILCETRAEWMIMANACFQNNATVVTLYTNLGNDGVIHAINETEAAAVVCSQETVAKIQEILPKCPHLKTVILIKSLTPRSGSEVKLACNVVKYHELAQGLPSGHVPPRKPPQANDCAIIMYTSGSTGNPKGVMLSHKNLLSSMTALINIAQFRQGDRYIAYLPLAHVLELLAETSCLMYGIKIGYSSAATLTNKSTKVKAGCKGDANVLRPTLMCSVPMVLERIYKSIVDTMKRQGWAAEELFEYLMQYKMKWEDRGFDTPLLNKTLFRKIRYFLGGRVRLMLSGGAPLSPDTHNLTRTCICVPLMQGYGLTETTACATVTNPKDRTTGRVGAPLMGIKIKLVNWEEGNYLTKDEPHPRGEIHVGGDNVALGYFKMKGKTDEDFYEENGVRWFKTGDIGEVHADGVLKIIDRKKDLIKLQHGEYVSYGKVESVLKTCPIVDNICLVGDSSKDYVVAVVLPDKTKLKSVTSKSLTECVQDEKVLQQILAEIQSFGKSNDLNKVELPAKIILAKDEWTPESGMVTAAFKIRRRQVTQKYEKEISKIYV